MILLALVGEVPRAAAQPCVGDCNGDGRVGVEELVLGVNIVLGSIQVSACTAIDFDGNGQVTIAELTRAVGDSLGGCRASVTITGGCTRPGPGPLGLVPCEQGTAIGAFRCADHGTCLHAASLPQVGATAVEVEGQWNMLIDAADAAADLIFEASIDGATTYRTLAFGTVGTGGRLLAGVAPRPAVAIGPSTEAAARLLDLNGLEHFSDAEISAVMSAVDAAASMLDFSVLASSGFSPADAADLATLTAVRDPQVTDTIQDAVFDPGTLPTRTPTPTPTATPVRRFAFVTNLGSSSVSVLDTVTDRVIDRIEVGKGPVGIAITPDSRLALVVNSDSETVSIIDTESHSVQATISAPASTKTNPLVPAVSADGKLVYVTNNAAGSVSVFSIAAALSGQPNPLVTTIKVGEAPLGIALGHTQPIGLVANFRSGTLTFINTDSNQAVGQVEVGGAPTLVALTSNDALAFVTSQLVDPGDPTHPDDTVIVVDMRSRTVVGRIAVGLQPTGVTVGPKDKEVFVVNSVSSTLSLFDPRPGAVPVTVPLLGTAKPFTVAITGDGRKAYVANCDLNSVSVVDTATAQSDPLNALVATIEVDNCPQAIAIVEP